MLFRRLAILPRRIRSLVRRRRLDADLDRELRAHLDEQIEENLARGMTPDEASRRAVATFGGVERIREESRESRGTAAIENLLRDLRHTLRALRREPMLVAAATLSIAVGAGGNLAVFSLAREFVFATPDVRRPGDLMQFQVSHGSHASYQRWLDIDASGALAQVAGYSIEQEINWRNGDVTSTTVPMIVTSNFFDVTGVPVVLGRGFTADEARAEDDPHLAVISHAFWQGKLAGDSSVLGRQLLLNGQAYTVLGVLAPRLRSVAGSALAPAVYLSLNRTLVPGLRSPGVKVVRLLGRLKPGQTLEQGRAAVHAVDRRLGRLQGDTVYAGVQEFIPAGSLGGQKARRVVGGFFLLLALVSLMVLLIACANVAGLLIARGTRRRQEIAIRLAIGGTRSRLIQQFLVEGFWLALIGTAAGVLLSFGFMRLVNSITLPIPLPVELNLAPDPALFLVAIAVVFLAILLCGVLPAFSATRLPLVPALKKEEPFYSNRRVTARGVLLAGQVTVSTVLLVTAFLFIRNLARTQVTDPGFEVERALVAQLGFARGQPPAEHLDVLHRAVERVRALPGVEQAAYSSGVQLTMYGASSSGLSAHIDEGEARHVEFSRLHVGPGYFGTLRIPLLGGREFQAADRQGAPAVAIVNAEFARRHFDGRNPVGSRLRFDGTDVTWEIVGMVANSKHQTLGEDRRSALYLPLLQNPGELSIAFVLARTRGDAARLSGTVQRELGALEQSVSVKVEPMGSALRFALLPSQVGAVVLGSLGVLGLILAAFGLYALVSYSVSRRVGEIAIRSALGATQSGILRLVIRDAAVLVGIGVALGLAISALVTAPLGTFLVTGLSTTDPLSFAGTAVVFLLVSVLAAWLPARSAIRVSPVVAMRLD